MRIHRTMTNRVFFLAIAVTAFALLAYGYYLQFFEDLEPCPMCIFQRLCYIGLGLCAVVGAAHGPRRMGAMFYCAVISLFSLLGAGIAARQTWLQHLPPELVPECGPGLEFMLDVYPLFETIKKSLMGTGDCAEVAWRFLGLSIAEWSLACFIGFVSIAIWRFQAQYRDRGPGS